MKKSIPSLILPVYLNQRIVFDLLAMLQDGFSQVTRVTSTEGDKDTKGQTIGATFGLSQALSGLLKIDLSGQQTSSREAKSEVARSEERVHTPSSLLYKLHQMLEAERQIAVVSDDYQPTTGDIVQFSTTLRRNPLVQTMDTMVGMVDLAATFSEPKPQSKRQAPGGDVKGLKVQMERFRDSLKVGGTVDIVSDRLGCGYTAVITLEEEHLSDPTMANLVEGHFTVLGKLIRVVPDDQGSVSLLRKAAISAMPVPLLDQMFGHFNAMSGEGGFDLPKIEWEVRGPAFQVLPIGIYA